MKLPLTNNLRLLPFLLIFLMNLPAIALAQTYTPGEKEEQCEKVAAAARHAWEGYMTYAKGYDALRPISKTGQNWYASSLVMTPVDAYDLFLMLGMDKEAKEAKELILANLNFNRDMEVQFFEVVIRLVGGLLSAYEMDHDPKLLNLANELGRRLMPAFESPTGMPFRYVNLRTGKTRDARSNPAEIGTCLLEFGKLTQLTGDSSYYKAADKAWREVYKRCSTIGLPGTIIDVNTGEWLNKECQIGARIDSYYEYLWKSWILFGNADCRDAFLRHREAIDRYMLTETPTGWYMTRVKMETGKTTKPLYGALDAFCAGLWAYSGEISNGMNLQDGNYHMWTHFNIEPEEFNFIADTIVWPSYPLRPENIESCFYLYRLTGKDRYLVMGKDMTDDILSKCRTEAGYAAVKDVRTMELEDSMESFFFAETLKYAWLLFAPAGKADLSKIVFNTEAHPLLIQEKK